jgi:NADH dehydrogenase
VVVGAGFGGLAAARHLAHGPLEVVVVDRTNHHLFQPFLYQVATAILSPGEIAPPIRSIFRRQPNVTVMLAEVTDVDLPRREIQLCGADGARRQLGYDYLIVAAGARDSYLATTSGPGMRCR